MATLPEVTIVEDPRGGAIITTTAECRVLESEACAKAVQLVNVLGDKDRLYVIGFALAGMAESSLQAVLKVAAERLDTLAEESALPLFKPGTVLTPCGIPECEVCAAQQAAVPPANPPPGGVKPRQWSGGTPLDAQWTADAEPEQVPA